ncbi:hypothetical protein LTS08_007130 [Lithohypha guttulata]|uniref:Uncharacterized protein n=1 Tax=Lithohypha guttulata TaxID=1690604 RepID=A0AAN7YH55_9EURO|nr:hypothetical protein LTR05_003884 [Lithohypha guttulata]KAK5097109.1 hypothetical protein LTS08_007130 [Lithohypha guttulata]
MPTDEEKCDLQNPCGHCEETWGNSKWFHVPCIRLNLHDIVTYRPGNARANQKRSTLPSLLWSLDFPQKRNISIAQDFLNVKRKDLPTFELECRRFVPRSSDTLYEPYEEHDGGAILIETPPYACSNATSSNTQSAFAGYLKKCEELAIEDLLEQIEDELLETTFFEVRRFASLHKESCVQQALQILAKVHIAKKQPLIVSEDTLDMGCIRSNKTEMNGKVPVPSVLDYQLDTLLMESCERDMDKVVTSLKSMMMVSRRKNWYEVFLTMVTLMYALEQVYNAQVRYNRKTEKAGAYFFTDVHNVSMYMMSQWRQSAKNLIYHFRVVIVGMLPFSERVAFSASAVSRMDSSALAYVNKMRTMLQDRRDEINKLCKNDLDNEQGRPLFWIAQLLVNT